MVTSPLPLQSHTPHISSPWFWREVMQICLKRGSKSASHSYVTGGSQTGRLVELGILSCCQRATASYWLIATAAPSGWKSLFLLIPLAVNLSGICSCWEQGCCRLAELCCGLLIPTTCVSICVGHLPAFCRLTCLRPDTQISLREGSKGAQNEPPLYRVPDSIFSCQ